MSEFRCQCGELMVGTRCLSCEDRGRKGKAVEMDGIKEVPGTASIPKSKGSYYYHKGSGKNARWHRHPKKGYL